MMLRRMLFLLLCFALGMTACGDSDDDKPGLAAPKTEHTNTPSATTNSSSVVSVAAGGISATTASTVELKATLGNGSAIDVVWAPDSQVLLIAGGKGIWRHEVGGTAPTLYKDYTYPLTFNADGSLVASQNRDRALVLWNPDTGELVETITASLESIFRIRFVDEQVAVLASGEVSVWEDGTAVASLQVEDGSLVDIAVRDDGRLVALGTDATSVVKVWDVRSGDVVVDTGVAAEQYYGGTLSPDGRLVAVPITQPGPEEGMFITTGTRIFDTTSGDEINVLDYSSTMAFNHDSTAYATISQMGNVIELVDLQTGETLQLGEAPASGPGYTYRWFRTMRFSPDGTRFADIDSNNVVELWDTRSGELLGTVEIFTSEARALDFHENQVVVGYNDGRVRWWDLQREQITEELELTWVNDIAISPAGDLLAIGAGEVQRWRLGDDSPQRQMPLGGFDWIGNVAFSPNGDLLAFSGIVWGPRSRSRESYIRVWDLIADTLAIDDIEAYDETIRDLEFSPDGTLLVSSNPEEGTHLWSVESGELVREIAIGANDIAFSPGGQVLATVEQVIRLWDVNTGEELNTFDLGIETLSAVVYSNDGTLLALAGGGKVVLVDVATGEVLRQFDNVNVSALAFSPDGDALVGVGFAGIVLVWR